MILAFWFLLPVPGLALLVRLDPPSLARGWLSAIARAYVLSLVLLTPVSVLGYVLHWPVLVLSVAWLVLVSAGVFMLWRTRGLSWTELRTRREPSGRLGPAAWVAGAWLLFDLWIGARVGSHVQGDAGFHLARVRMLLEVGLGSWDPLLEGLQFEPVYHTNLYHGLIASSAQLARVDAGAAWIWAWPFAKLFIAAASYELALSVLAERWLAWLATLVTGTWFATQSIVPYPNVLAPYGFLAFGLAAVSASYREPDWGHAGWIGASSLLLAQTHMLYALFFALLVAPVLLVRLVRASLRRSTERLPLLAAVCALGLSAPWLAVPALPQLRAAFGSVARAQEAPALPQLREAFIAVAHAQASAPVPPPTARERKAGLFVEVRPGLVHMDPAAFFGWNEPLGYLLLALVLYAALTRRAAALGVLAIVATCGSYMFVPALCSALLSLLGANWIMARLSGLLNVLTLDLLVPLCAAVLVLGLRRLLSGRRALRWAEVGLELVGVVAALAYVNAQAKRAEPWTIATTWHAAKANQAAMNAEKIARRAQFFAAQIPAGANVLAPLFMDYQLPMHCNCRALAFRRGRGGRKLDDIEARRAATDRFYAQDTPGPERAELVARFDVLYVYSSPRRARSLARDLAPRVESIASDGPDAILRLKP